LFGGAAVRALVGVFSGDALNAILGLFAWCAAITSASGQAFMVLAEIEVPLTIERILRQENPIWREEVAGR